MKSAKFVMSLGAVGVISAFTVPQYLWIGCIFMFYALAVYIYVFKSFHHFMVTFNDITVSNTAQTITFEKEEEKSMAENEINIIPAQSENNTNLSAETYQMIQKHIGIWIEQKGYTTKGVTIQTVASKVYTNRTYLSNYINTTYKCSFKVWITRLRVEEAKRLLMKNVDMNIGDVAHEIGCSSSTSFTHLFKQVEHTSPIKWRANEIDRIRKREESAENTL